MKLSLPPKLGRWLIIAAAALFIIVLIGGRSGLLALFSAHRQTLTMETDIRRLNLQMDSLNLVIDRLQHDTAFIERMAREKLGMARSDEKVFKFIDNSPATNP